MIDDTVLITKHRPDSFEGVFGQDTACAAVANAIAKQTSRQFMFIGPSGTGKTTLARIAAAAYGCAEVMEIDAATSTGVDAMRDITRVLDLLPLSGERRAVVLDEAHRLTGNAWDACLKSLEEPPPHVVWFICTTNPAKIPDTVTRRCLTVTLKPVALDVITDLLEQVAAAEGMDLADPEIVAICARAAYGSPGKALANLAKCAAAETAAQARELCREAAEIAAVPELCRLLMKGGSWASAVALIKETKGQDNESVRIAMANYLAAVVAGAKTPDVAARTLYLLEPFMAAPWRQSDGIAPLLLAVGGLMLYNDPAA